MKKLLYFCVFFYLSASGNTLASSGLLKKVPKNVPVNTLLTLEPIAGHHFNLQARNSCGGFPLQSLTEQSFKCTPNKPGTLHLIAAVCDDAKSFCKLEIHDIQITDAKKKRPLLKKTPPLKKEKSKTSKFVHGFINNQPQEALQKAKKANKLLLIDFFGIWCPPCTLLEEQVLSTTAFAKATTKYVKVRIDIDTNEASAWMKHFRVNSYPTLLVTNHNLEEVDRFTGGMNLEFTLNWLHNIESLGNKTIIKAEAEVAGFNKKHKLTKAQKETFTRLIKWHYEARNFDKAILHAKRLKTPYAKKIRLQSKLAKIEWHKKKKRCKKRLLIKLLKKYKNDVSYGSWTKHLLQLDYKQGQKYVGTALKNIHAWLKNPDLAKTGHAKATLTKIEAKILESIGKEKLAQEKYTATARLLDEMDRQTKTAHGAKLYKAILYEGAGKAEKALAVYANLLKHQQHDFNLNYSYAKLLYDQNMLEKALIHAKKAVDNSYGDMRFWSNQLVAEILISLNKTDEARKRIQAVLHSTKDIEEKSTAGYYRTKLEELLANLENERTKAPQK